MQRYQMCYLGAFTKDRKTDHMISGAIVWEKCSNPKKQLINFIKLRTISELQNQKP